MTTYRLKGTSGAVVNRAFPLAGRLVVGRAGDCDLCIDHDSVAPHHAEFTVSAAGRVTVRDLGSGLGTRVNGEAVSERSLAGGDEIQLGTSRLMLQAPGLRPERVLGAEPARKSGWRWVWLVLALLAAGALVWRFGYLDFLLLAAGG